MNILKIKVGLLPKIIISIALGILFSSFLPVPIIRIFTTFNGLFSNFLDFVIPLIILGLVAPGIAELGKGAGALLWITTAIAYCSTLFAGFFSFTTCSFVYPSIIEAGSGLANIATVDQSLFNPYFLINMPPIISVMGALITAFLMGLGLSTLEGNATKNVLSEFRDVIMKVISSIIIPLLPFYIFGIFLKMGAIGQVSMILGLFAKVIVIILLMDVVLLTIQYTIAGILTKKNPFKLLKNMMPAYFTALGTQSSAATIPVTLRQSIKNGVGEELAGFVIPLCATIHLSGSILKIVACSMALMMLQGMPISLGMFTEFIFMLGIAMVAAPGVPGGAIMAALGLLASILHFDEAMLGMMIAIYITMDSTGTACNVTGDGAIALIVDKIKSKKNNSTKVAI